MSFQGNSPRSTRNRFTPQSSAPVNPQQGDLYYDDGTSRVEGLYVYKNSAWVLVDASNSNLIPNPDMETNTTAGWLLGNVTLTSNFPSGVPTFGSGASGTLSLAVTTSSPLAGSYSLRYADSAATTAGNFVATDAITVQPGNQARVLQLTADYRVTSGAATANFSGTASNSLGVAIYDITNAVWIQPAGVYNLVQNSGVGKLSATVQTPSNSTSLRVVIYNANATSGALTVDFDNVYLGPQIVAQGAAMADAKAVTVTGSWVSNTTYTCFETQIGDQCTYRFRALLSGAPTATSFILNLPAGRTIDTAKLAAAQASSSLLGMGTAFDNGTETYPVGVEYQSPTSIACRVLVASGANLTSGAAVTQAAPFTFGNTDWVEGTFTVPIVGLSSNTVMSNDTDTRVISFNGTYSGTQAVTANVTNISMTAGVDRAGTWNGTQFVVPVSGDYLVSGAVNVSTTATSIAVYRNAATATSYSFFSASAAANTQSAGSVLVTGCVAGDTISLRSNVSCNVLNASIGIFRLSGPATIAASEKVVAIYQDTAGSVMSRSTSGGNDTPWTTVPYPTRIVDSHSAMSSGVFTAPIAGQYQVNACAAVNNVSGNTRSQMRLFKNNTTIVGRGSPGGGAGEDASGNAIASASVSMIVDLLAGETVRAQIYFDDNTADRNLVTTAGFNMLSVALIK